MDTMKFKELYAIYKEDLPTQAVFFYDGKHSVTPKDVARHYGARKMHTIWDKFAADYAGYVSKVKATAKPVPKKTVDKAKPKPTKEV